MSQGRISARILFAYRTTPQSTTGVSPAQLLLGRQTCTRLDLLLHPNITTRVKVKQFQQNISHDKKAQARQFNIGDLVLAKNFGSGQKWLILTIIHVTGPVSYLVRLQNHTTHRRHQDQLRKFRRSDDIDLTSVDPHSRILMESNPSTSVDAKQQPVESEAHPNSVNSVTTDSETPSLPVTSDGQSVVESTALEAESAASLMETVEPVPITVTHKEAPPSSATQTQATPRKIYPKRQRRPPDRYK